MSGDSFPLNLPLPRFATDSCEATDLYRELRKPLLRYLVGLGLSTDEAQDVAQDAFLSLHKHLAADGSQDNIRSWLFRVAHNAGREITSKVTPSVWASRSIRSSMLLRALRSPEQTVLAQEQFRRLDTAVRALAIRRNGSA